jgi:hypothetical protein
MPNHDNNHLERAAEYWRGGQAIQAGKLIFENIPAETRPKWASRLLRLVLGRSGIQSSIFEQVLHTADDQAMWRNGHRVFSAVRASTLELDELERTHGLTKEQKLLGDLLSLAELVAKVTYNATDPPDEFDEDTGWWIAVCLRGFVDNVWTDDEFSKAAWSTLCSEEG